VVVDVREDIVAKDAEGALKEFVAMRCEEIITKDKEYQQLIKNNFAICNKLKRRLTRKQFDLFLNYECNVSDIQTLTNKLLYKAGMRDILKIV
jgi:hypothetical protein